MRKIKDYLFVAILLIGVVILFAFAIFSFLAIFNIAAIIFVIVLFGWGVVAGVQTLIKRLFYGKRK